MMRRGAILLMVMGIVVLGTLIAAGVLSSTHSRAIVGSLAEKREQSRLLAWSGIVAIMGELETQRSRLLSGENPELTASWTPYEAGSRRAVVRLLKLEAELNIVSENAKLDANASTIDMLAKLDALEANTSPIESKRPLDAIEDTDELPESAAKFLTTFSFDTDERGSTPDPRIDMNVAWSPELAQELARHLGPERTEALRLLRESGVKVENESDLVKILARAGVEGDSWTAAMSTLTVRHPDGLPVRVGRVDVNRAAAEVLACVPGIDRAAADRIISMRGSLSATERTSIGWVVAKEILTTDQFAEAVRWLTARSLVWRVRVEAGLSEPEEGIRTGEVDEIGLLDRTVLEAVIDLSDRRPRVAFLRDVTLLDIARGLTPPLTDEGEAEPKPSEVPVEPLGNVSFIPETPPPSPEAHTLGPPSKPADPRIGRWRSARPQLQE